MGNGDIAILTAMNRLDIPLSLYATCYKLEKSNLRYSELFVKMQQQLDVAKK